MIVNENFIRNVIKNTLNEMSMASNDGVIYYVVDDGEIYNVFGTDQFDENGNYLTDPSINIGDLDIVKTFSDMDKAFAYADKLNDNIF